MSLPRHARSLGLLALLVACGGKVVEDDLDGSADGSAAPEDGGTGSDGASVTDSGRLVDTGVPSPPPVKCSGNSGGGSSGAGACDTFEEETCSDGKTYQVHCSCPSATCTCGSQVVPFAGCPMCPIGTAAFEACGYPH